MEAKSISSASQHPEEFAPAEMEKDKAPTLFLSMSLIETLPKRLDLPFRHSSEDIQSGNRITDTNPRISFSPDTMFPAITTSVERQPLKPGHRGRRHESNDTWKVYARSDWRDNIVDTKTIYNKGQSELLHTLSEDKKILPPLNSSPRMAANVPDSHDLHEKVLVMRQYFSLGVKGHCQIDKAVLPTVYTDFFTCPERKQKYINSLWLEHFKNKPKKKPDYWKYNSGKTDSDNCTYCDVMGSKYCSFCREFKNRNFALSYEANYLPSIGGLRTSKKASGSRYAARQDTSRRQSLVQKQGKLPKRRKVKQDRSMLLPITYIPQDGKRDILQ